MSDVPNQEKGLEALMEATPRNSRIKIMKAAASDLWSNRREHARNYRSKWINFAKDIAPATVANMTVAGLATQYASSSDAGKIWETMAPYAGYLVAYPTYFTTHYLRNKSLYPEGLISRAYAKHVGHFMAADYVSDPIFASPPLIAVSYYLGQHTTLPGFTVGATAALVATSTWMSAMVIVQPSMELLSSKINNGIKKYVVPVLASPYKAASEIFQHSQGNNPDS